MQLPLIALAIGELLEVQRVKQDVYALGRNKKGCFAASELAMTPLVRRWILGVAFLQQNVYYERWARFRWLERIAAACANRAGLNSFLLPA